MDYKIIDIEGVGDVYAEKLTTAGINKVSELLEKCDRYTDYDMKKKEGKHYGAAALLLRPLWKFLSFYFLQGHYRDGLRGVLFAGTKAVYQFALVAKVIEQRLKSE